ncbi:MAG: Low-affinity inorganic phosphate transporter [uncultured Paraburkholderia sp.]|nr:MAG: Low-affinity inorganic phosphate transporter [uncultured Paraburkholderia sp.]CAH2912014.1 MAG: Low-affinity inorganic phosphate transporter [uncultured Paraburkholderia sp.]
MAMLTIGAADMYGLPVSTTHVLSSGVAGHDGRQRFGPAMGHRAQPRARMGADAAGFDRTRGRPVLVFRMVF